MSKEWAFSSEKSEYIGTALDTFLWYRLPIVCGEVDRQSYKFNGRGWVAVEY
jgi:hypothetical protein